MSAFSRHLCCWLAVIFTALAPVPGSPVQAGDDDQGLTFLTPFPDNEVYQVVVYGDRFADGLLAGLLDAFGSDVRMNIQRQVTPFSGIGLNDFDAKVANLEKTVATQPLNIAIVMVGQDDRFSFRGADGKRLPAGGEAWTAEYTRRIDRLMRAFKSKSAGVYWVGLPNVARPDANDLAQKMNDVIRERAYLNGFKYIDAYQGFTDENGAYSPYGPDLGGAIRLLRLRDGVNFTDAGNRKLAHFVEKELRPDLIQAKANRNLPLLGAEAEQAKINPDNAVKTPAPSSPVAQSPEASGRAPVVKGASHDGSPPSGDGSGDQKADNGRITLKIAGPNGREETQTIEIVRPAIPASVVALMARREGSGQRGDLLVDQIAGGLTLMSSISPAGNKDRGRLSPTLAPYFRLLVKGERLQPKPGRADDVTWPPKPDTTSQSKPAETPGRG
ncbi:SGNH/GDSL hydrolase family protein [Hyphomicrobium sp.]|uniref:SGNH/GDSL hydrolase family protein n=1 Tax=Hyphomicrobium sp. TaxID=82 RepID=UPI002D771628|nr:SGNH/GDSL hydrolase family protein [Hyphomicrobium sp.]HET6390330.1 SGNH/GDSL hydrolase family protein [Hyphomicrobium sp.]